MIKQGILVDENVSSLFFRVCIEISVDFYVKKKSAPQTSPLSVYQAIDALAKLSTFLIILSEGNEHVKVKTSIKILTTIWNYNIVIPGNLIPLGKALKIKFRSCIHSCGKTLIKLK